MARENATYLGKFFQLPAFVGFPIWLLRSPDLLSATWNSLRIVGLAALFCSVLGLLVGYVVVRLQGSRHVDDGQVVGAETVGAEPDVDLPLTSAEDEHLFDVPPDFTESEARGEGHGSLVVRGHM